MTHDSSPVLDLLDDEEPPGERVRWEVAEVAAVAILVAVGALAAGALVSAIWTAIVPSGPFPSNAALVGQEIEVGAEWASFVLAALLVGVIGASWFTVSSWSELAEAREDADDSTDALAHLVRARKITLWAFGELALTFLASVAGFIGGILENLGLNTPADVWARQPFAVANVLAVAAIAAAGLSIGRRLIAAIQDATGFVAPL